MNTPPPLPETLQAKFSWKHYVGMILVCLFVSTCTKVMIEVTPEAIQKAQIETSYLTIENLQKQVRLQQAMIDLQWEEIEEIADAEASINKGRWILFSNESGAKPSKSKIDFNFQRNRGFKTALFFRGNFSLSFVAGGGYVCLHDIEPNDKSTIFSEDLRYGRKRAAFPSGRDSLGQAQ